MWLNFGLIPNTKQGHENKLLTWYYLSYWANHNVHICSITTSRPYSLGTNKFTWTHIHFQSESQRHWLSDCNLCLGFGIFFGGGGGCLMVAKSDMTLELDRTRKLNTIRHKISKLWVKTYRDHVIFRLTWRTYLIYVLC